MTTTMLDQGVENENETENEDVDEVEDNYARSTRVHTNGNVGKHFKKPKRNSQLVATNATYAGTCSEPAAKKMTRILQCKGCSTMKYPILHTFVVQNFISSRKQKNYKSFF